MKIRSGFVSNSSSSSFIISGEENIKKAKEIIENMRGEDYYELDSILYTSFISDCDDKYGDLSKLSIDYIEGGDYPYNEEDFFEFEGDLGISSVYIEKNRCKDKLKAEQDIKDKLYDYVKKYIEQNEISRYEAIFESDEILRDLPYFLEICCDIVGYKGE